jgi:hypothetical protein
MASKTTIANQALYLLKNSKTITNVDTDTSIQATVINTFYPDVLNELLRKFDWPFAKKIDDLALVEEDPNDGVEWLFSYRWPSDCVKARYIVDGLLQHTVTAPFIEFEVGSDVTGRLILTNEEDAQLCYTMAVTDVTLMPESFRKALTYSLAYNISPTICGDDRTGLGQRAFQLYQLELSNAMAEFKNERKWGFPPESEFILGR